MAKTNEQAPTLYVVVNGFYAEPTPYREGEVVEADDPFLKATPERFRPFEFPHPVKRATTLSTPELRAK